MIDEYGEDLRRVTVLPYKEVLQYHAKMRTGDTEARNALWTSVLRLVAKIVSAHTDDPDTLANANLTALEAVEAWDPERGALSTIVGTYVRNYLRSWKPTTNAAGIRIPASTWQAAKQLEERPLDELIPTNMPEHRRQARKGQVLMAHAAVRGCSLDAMLGDEEPKFQLAAPKQEPPRVFCIADLKTILGYVQGNTRKAIKMRVLDGAKDKQIAGKLGIPIRSVRPLVEKGLAKLQRVRECKLCGTTFLRNHGQRTFCSQKCYDLSRRREKPVLTCLHCGKLYFQKVQKQVFCSAACCAAWWLERRRIRGKVLSACEYCGKEFKSNRVNGEKKHRFCSKGCWNAWKHEQDVIQRNDGVKKIEKREKGESRFTVKRTCPVCKKEFFGKSLATKGVGGVWCSKECQLVALYPARSCEFCGKEFRSRNATVRHCSIACANEAKRTRNVTACLVCGAEFRKRKETHETCSKGCANRLRSIRRKNDLVPVA